MEGYRSFIKGKTVKILKEVYVAQHTNGFFFGERGYGNLTEDLCYAMLAPEAKNFDSYFRLANAKAEDFKIVKLLLCKE